MASETEAWRHTKAAGSVVPVVQAGRENLRRTHISPTGHVALQRRLYRSSPHIVPLRRIWKNEFRSLHIHIQSATLNQS